MLQTSLNMQNDSISVTPPNATPSSTSHHASISLSRVCASIIYIALSNFCMADKSRELPKECWSLNMNKLVRLFEQRYFKLVQVILIVNLKAPIGPMYSLCTM